MRVVGAPSPSPSGDAYVGPFQAHECPPRHRFDRYDALVFECRQRALQPPPWSAQLVHQLVAVAVVALAQSLDEPPFKAVAVEGSHRPRSDARHITGACSVGMAPLADFLAAHDTLTLATTGPDGPAAAALFYAPLREGLLLLFVSDPTSRHARHLAADPRCAATVHADGQAWRGIRGAQLRGSAAPAPRRDWPRYLARFPMAATVPELAAALGRTRLYRLEVAWARLIDNRQGFGHRDEWEFAAGALSR